MRFTQAQTPYYLQSFNRRYDRIMTETMMQRGLLQQAPDILSEFMPHTSLGIVCDETTMEIAGEALHKLFEGRAILISLGKRLRPTIDLSEKLRRQVAQCDALLAVGSGTVTDLTKYVAHRLGIPFSIFATAPSMNGYLSPTASLIFGKQKTSVDASAARLVMADTNILTQAPLKMLRAGIGDITCRSSIESDLILAHRFTGTHYNAQDFSRIRELDEGIRSYDGEVHQRDEALVGMVMEALLVGGKMMQEAGSSTPCSQSEHMVAHTYDMLYGGLESQVLHGEAISVTTVTMVKLQQKLIKRKPRFKPVNAKLETMKRVFGSSASHESLLATYEKKQLSQERCDELNDQMPTLWPEIQAMVEERAAKLIHLEAALVKLGCVTNHKQLRWHKDRYENALTNAHLTRDRFTFLDITAMDKVLRAEI